MKIDLSLLHTNQVNEVSIHDSYSFTDDYSCPDILGLSDIKVDGIITLRDDKDVFIGTISGSMIITDSISLEEVSYPFEIQFDDFLPENYIKNENTLDILGFLWENIVLEVPLRFTKVQDLSKYHGDGWRMIREEERRNENNPFLELLNDFEEE